ncbi:hypothetical protein, partial [Tessaracoccus sp. O5.2]|uniref:hypothetical protein n=1 Tax=Tessaracoccus sp. O5.2 TaxID=3157622 RepID=UPI0036D89E79
AAASQKCFNQQKLQPLTKTQKLDQSINHQRNPKPTPKRGPATGKNTDTATNNHACKNWH